MTSILKKKQRTTEAISRGYFVISWIEASSSSPQIFWALGIIQLITTM